MNDDRIAAPMAQALADKGYTALTPVQEAVLGDGPAGRDLLVSAQTGSGKTVAFGLAIAPEVLGNAAQLLYADKPLALVVAPTRELALQVRREFEWLYGPAGAHLASCVGGMDQRTERRALERGAHIVVGTPGRLRDHIERGSLDLSALKAVVLDEADEMLDMGFQEDLEFILAGAPPERRTLMFSATVPKAIEGLAASYQRDAMRIVARGEAKQHVDIEYRALNVATRDREHAIFNVLRYYEAPTAIVFCKTRANVNHLLARMGNRGFQVVALSGELSQQERTHALQALRDGRARVCIATDVAARGIDLPGLELVIHADLPSNSEVLLHRSGRTGRAGSKGVSCLIVTPPDFRKAQRLLAGAKVVADWAPAPDADAVQAKDDLRILEHPTLTAEAEDEAAMADALLARFGADRVATAFVRLWREGRSAPEELSTTAAAPDRAAASPPRERAAFGPAAWFSLSVGHEGRAEARWLLPKLCDAGGITKDAIGAIRVQRDETFVQIAEAEAGKFRDGMEIEAGLILRRLPGEPAMDRAPRPAPARPAPRAPRAAPEATPRPEAQAAPSSAPRTEVPRPPKPAYQPKPARIVDEAEAAPAAPKKPRWTPDDRLAPSPAPAPASRGPKSAGFRSHGGAGKSEGFKSHGGKPAGAEGARPRPASADTPRPARAKPAGPAGPRAPGPKQAWAKGPSDRPAGAKPAWAKPAGDKPAGAKPAWAKPAGDKPAGAKPFRAKPPGGKPGAKPFAAKPRAPKPVTDARDTSKRFVPPKRPKG